MVEPQFDPIVAVATAPGMGGVGIVRLSGAGVRDIAARLFSGELRHSQLRYGQLLGEAGETLDQGLAVLFEAPRSFTGEDVVEFHGHGGPVVLSAIVAACQALGARLARPGEFSERAFLNGKMDLTQAEAIADLIASSSTLAARGALRSLQGAFSKRVDEIAEQVLWLRTYVEATLDFPDEEDVDHMASAKANERLVESLGCIDQLLLGTAQSVLLTEGVQVALLGAPNVGKSSLLNRLAQQERAIVSDIPGTTRDLLEADLVLDGLPITLIDTAGLRNSDDPVEREGVRRALRRAGQVDLVICVSTPGQPFNDRSVEIEAGAARLDVVNKIDLKPTLEPGWVSEPVPLVRVSATEGQGMDALVAAIKQAVGFSTDAAPFSARRRHLESLGAAKAALQNALAALAANDGGVLLAEELREAHEHLGAIVGRITADDLLGEIFGSFCIGK